ncbi:MAG: hypothetical protein PHC68_08985 [Syntrophorhabdaceae bacterium]|nr:hypothetical protein [Syntrophorhabdaceae bacterium]
MGDVISYPDVPSDDRDGHDEGGFAEGGYDELEKLFLKLKKETEENKGIRYDGLDIPLANEDAVRKLEAESNGIWATVGELAYAYRKKRVTIWRQIRKRKWIVRRVSNRQSRTGYNYLIWIIDPLTIKDINDERVKMKSMKSVKIEVPRTELFVLRDMDKIDEETFTRLMREGGRKFRFQFLVPEKTLHQVFKKGMVLPDSQLPGIEIPGM